MNTRRHTDRMDNNANKRARLTAARFPLEDRRLFSYITTFMSTRDLGQLWMCSRAAHNICIPNLVPRVVWGPGVFSWAHDPTKSHVMLPLVKLMN